MQGAHVMMKQNDAVRCGARVGAVTVARQLLRIAAAGEKKAVLRGLCAL